MWLRSTRHCPFVSRLYLLELLGIAAAIWMMLPCQTAVRCLYLGFGYTLLQLQERQVRRHPLLPPLLVGRGVEYFPCRSGPNRPLCLKFGPIQSVSFTIPRIGVV